METITPSSADGARLAVATRPAPAAHIVAHPRHAALLELRAESGRVLTAVLYGTDVPDSLRRAILRLRATGQALGYVVVDWPGRDGHPIAWM